MVDVLGTNIPIDIPSFSLSPTTWVIMIVVFIFLILGGVAFWYFYRRMTFNKKIVFYENISGQGWKKAGIDKARLVKIGDGGEELLYLLKRKVYRTAYGKKMDKNEYWFAKGQDGYEYNVVLGDLDAKMGMLDIEPIDRDMRYMHVAVRKNIQDRYRKIKFMEKYGTIMMSGIFLLIMIGGIWFLLDKMGDIGGTISSAMETANKVSQLNQQVLTNIENVCSGSGLIPVA